MLPEERYITPLTGMVMVTWLF